jgi:hypothetical protein
MKEKLQFTLFIIILLVCLFGLIKINNNLDKESYNQAVAECGSAEKVERHFNSVDQIEYYTCKK